MSSIVERIRVISRTRSGTGGTSKACLLLFACACLFSLRLTAQPVNDRFTNAVVIAGPSGSIAGTTINATSEPGEPIHYFSFRPHGGRSVWFSWTAPYSGFISMNTVGSQFDTILAVYTGSSLNALTQIASDDDSGVFVSGDPFLPALVTFPITAGTVYHIAVDGYNYGAGPETGPYSLNWGGATNGQTVVSNEVGFSSANYAVNEDTPGFITISVLAGGGFTNNSTVDYYTSDGSAVAGQDYLSRSNTLVFTPGDTIKTFSIPILDNSFQNSNKTILLTLTNATGDAVFGARSNAVVTIVDDETPPFVSAAGQLNIVVTNNFSGFGGFFGFFGQGLASLVTENETFESFLGYVSPVNETSVKGALVTVTRTAPASGRILVDYYTTNTFFTNFFIFGTNTSGTNASGTNIYSARPGFDYQPVSGTLMFDDYQMMANFIVPVGNGFTTTTPTNFLTPLFFDVVLTNPRPAPEEDPTIIAPTIGVGQGTVEILKVNNFDGVSIERRTYRAEEYNSFSQGGTNVVIPANAHFVDIDLILPGGGCGNCTVNVEVNVYGYFLLPGSDYADPFRLDLDNTLFTDGATPIINFPDYGPLADRPGFDHVSNVRNQGTIATVLFPDANVTRRTVRIVITNDNVVEFNEDIGIFLTLPGNSGIPAIGNGFANATILYDDQPAGAADREWNPEGVLFTNPRFNVTPGANSSVSAVAIQPDGKTIIGGDFDHYNSITRNHLARLNFDGSLDTSFNPGTGADRAVDTVVLYGATGPNAGKMLIGGAFTSYNGVLRNRIARVNANGSLDTTFAPGNGANGTVRTIALQSDGKVLVAGEFTVFNDLNVNGVMRLNTNGTVDTTFNPGFGANNIIWSILVDEATTNRLIYIAGDFTLFDGTPRNYIARLTDDGALDPTFDPGLGPDNSVYALALQADGKLLLGGAFGMYHTSVRNSLARINADGSLDASYNVGAGADNAIYTITLQPDGKALIGGVFGNYNHTRRLGLARVFTSGSLDTSFMDSAYNQFAGFPKTFSFDNPSFINAIAVQSDSNIMVGGSFTNMGGNLSVHYATTNHTTVPSTNFFFLPYTYQSINGRTNGHNSGAHLFAQFTRQDKTTRFNVARVIGGHTPGPGNMEYDPDSTFTANENNGSLTVTLRRVDGRLGTAAAVPSTTNNTAIFPFDFTTATSTQVWEEWTATENAVNQRPFSPRSVGFVGLNYFSIPIADDSFQEGDETFGLVLSNAFGSITLGGEYIPLGAALGHLDGSLATVADNDFDYGVFNFELSEYVTNENAITAVISVIRTNGSWGQVSVDYRTRNGTATAGTDPSSDYQAASGRLTFFSGETNKTFNVTVSDNPDVEFDETVILILTNAAGGAKLPGGTGTSIETATLTIIDDDFLQGRLNFQVSHFTNNENEVTAVIGVTRTGGNVGTMAVDFTTATGTATPFSDYTPTNGTLTWADGDSATKYFTIPLNSDGFVEAPESVLLRLSNAIVTGTPDYRGLGGRTNATLWITDGDAYGMLAFKQPFYEMDENGGLATITVVRSGGSAGTVSVNFGTAPIVSAPGTDYFDTNGVLTFLPGEFSKTFQVRIIDNPVPDGERTVRLVLSNPVNAGLGALSNIVLTIVDNESINLAAGSLDTTFSALAGANAAVYAVVQQPDGRLIMAGDFTQVTSVPRNRLARLKPSGLLDNTFDIGPGANDSIRALALTGEGKLLIGGLFTSVNGTNRARVARLATDGKVDVSFNPGAGADNPVFAIALQPNEKVLVGGAFSSFNGITRPGLVRLNTNGLVDTTFNTGAGFNGPVYAVDVQNDGKILVGGNFTMFNGAARTNFVRLNANGSLDLTFNPALAVGAPVRAILVEPDGRIVIGGSFTNINELTRNYLARLGTDGTVDPNFLSSAASRGADSTVYALEQQVDGRLVVVGDFRIFNGVTRNGITRLFDEDGSTDPTINFGNGANAFVAALVIQPDRRIVIGGGFTAYNDIPRQYIARIYGGSISGSGALEYSQPVFSVSESSTNAVITVRRVGGTTGEARVDAFTRNGTATNGVHYLGSSNTLIFPQGETRQSFNVPIIPNDVLDGNRSVNLNLANFVNAVAGPTPGSTLLIKDDEASIGFSSDSFGATESAANRSASVTLIRFGATDTLVSVDITTVLGGSATPFADYIPTNATVSLLPGEISRIFNVPVLTDTNIEGTETIFISLSNPVGTTALGISNAVINLTDNNIGAGQLLFLTNNFQVDESSGFVTVTILRTNGSSGFVSARLVTANGSATGFADYIPTNTFVTFAEGETVKSVVIPILQDSITEPDETFLLTLSQPAGGVAILTTNSIVTIFDDEISPSYVGFETNNFFVNEPSPGFATINVVRTNSRRGSFTVDFHVSNGSATAGLDYFTTNGTLTFVDGENIKAFTIPIVNDVEGEGPETVRLTLSNLQSVVASFLTLPTSTLTILDDDTTLRFSSTNYFVFENGGAAVITVERVGVTNTAVSVDYATTTGGTAVAGLDYTPVTGTLSWALNDATPKTFLVPIIDNNVLNQPKTVFLILNNAVGAAAYVTAPTNAVLTILDDESLAPTSGPVDPLFNANFGANGTVQSISYDASQRLYVGGDFTQFHGLFVNRITRLTTNGAVDINFNVGTGADAIVYSVSALSNSVYVGGAFTNINGAARGRIARLLASGAVDTLFNPTNGAADAPVHAIAVAPNQQVIIGGEFLNYGGNPAPRLARINPDGSFDATFNIGTGVDGIVRAVAVQPNGQVLIGGDFGSVNGFLVSRVARLNVDGTLDTTFTIGLGADGAVNSIAVGPDGKILIAGDFVTINGVPRNGVARLNSDGSVDISLDIGTGADASVRSVAIEVDGHILVAGAFTNFNGNPLRGVARLNSNGSLDNGFTPGTGADAPVNSISLVPRTLAPAFAFMSFDSLAPNSATYSTYTENFLTLRSATGGVFSAVSNTPFLTGALVNSANPQELTLGGYTFTLQSIYFTNLTAPVTVTASSGGTAIVFANGTYFFPPSFLNAAFVRITPTGSAVIDNIVAVPGADAFLTPSFAIGGDFETFNNVQRGGVAVLTTGGTAFRTFDPRNISTRSVFATAVYTNLTQPTLIGKIIAGGDFTAIVGVDGINRLARLNIDGTLDTSFNTGLGLNAPVRAVAVQPDGKVVFGGFFTTYDLLSRAYLGRANVDGTLDNTFNFGVGLDNAVLALALQPDGKVVIGGQFTTVYGTSRNGIARVHTNGTVDVTFAPGTGANGAVRAVALQPDGKVLIGGDFTMINNVSRFHIARLNTNGTVDATFNPGAGTDGTVNAIALTSSGGVLIGGAFTNFNGVPARRVALLTSSGAQDGSFNPGSGANDYVTSIQVQGDGRIVVGGNFTMFNGQVRNRIVRLNSDGSLDPTINFGTGANDVVNTVSLQNYDGKIVIGGSFTEVDGLTRVAIARLFAGTNFGSGTFRFSSPTFTVNENAGTGVVTVVRGGGLLGTVSVQYSLANGTATSPADYTAVSGTLVFNEAENVKFINVPVNNDNTTNGDRTFIASLLNPSPGTSIGSPSSAVVTIVDDDSVISFTSAAYLVNENGAIARISVTRTGGAIFPATVEFRAETNGTATAGFDFTPRAGLLSFGPGVRVQTFDVPIIDDTLNEFDETVPLTLLNANGAALGLSSATLTIVENDFSAGVVTFGTNSYFVSEDAGFIAIEVLRTNGHTGPVSVNYQTISTGSALPNVDYVTTNGLVTFADGQTNAFLIVQIIDDVTVGEGDDSFPVQIFGPSGGATLGLADATITIIDDDKPGEFTFSSTLYTISESNAFVRVTIIRTNGNFGDASVTLLANGGSATPGADYDAVSNVLTFADGQNVRTFDIQIRQDGLVEGTETIDLLLLNPTGGTTLRAPFISRVNIIDDEVAVGFSVANYIVNESLTNVTITLVRTGDTNNGFSVTANTSDGTALATVDYVPLTTTITFAPGETNKTFTVAVLDDQLAEGDEFLNLTLSSASGGVALGPIATSRLTILDNDSAFVFSSANYSTNEGTVDVVITVLRLGFIGTTSAVDYATFDGTATTNLDYLQATGRLAFAAFQTSAFFTVRILDDFLIEGNETINLTLGNPLAPAFIGSQGAAVLTILDNDTSIGFSRTNYVVSEKVTNAVITLVRNGSPTQPVQVTLQVLNGTAALGSDYGNPSATTITWAANDITPKEVRIPIFDDALPEGSETVILRIINPLGAFVDPATGQAILNIVDNGGAIAFASVNYTVVEGSGNALLNLVRTGGSNGTVSVQWNVTGGTATPGQDYSGSVGTVVFAHGERNKPILLPISEDDITEGVETLNLILSAADGGATIGSPSAATLSIIDNDTGIIVGAGSALIEESFLPPNNVIDPFETVTLLFALRNTGQVDANNVTAFLVYSNGISHTNVQVQNYGALFAGGNSVSRPFTFTATGTNGTRITATLMITNNGLFLGPVSFDFVLGQQNIPFQNATTIFINDNTNATPYPSTLTISGVSGPLNGLAVTLHGLNHTYPDDIDMMLIGPNGVAVMLMSDAGGGLANGLNNVTITFDDAAPNAIPDSLRITNGMSYRCANYLTQTDPFPGFPNNTPWTNTSLASFNGISPNGVWSLYIVDDASGQNGQIVNGWSLNVYAADTVIPGADVSVAVTDAPDPVTFGGTVNYTIAVTNHGPSAANSVMLTNIMPPEANFISASGPFSFTQNGNVLFGSLGTIPMGAGVVITVTMNAPNNATLLTFDSTVGSGAQDLNMGNNHVSIKTSVNNAAPDMVPLFVARKSGQLVLSWQSTATNIVLESSSTVGVGWNGAGLTPVVSNGVSTVTAPLNSTTKFFRLKRVP